MKIFGQGDVCTADNYIFHTGGHCTFDNSSKKLPEKASNASSAVSKSEDEPSSPELLDQGFVDFYILYIMGGSKDKFQDLYMKYKGARGSPLDDDWPGMSLD